MSRESPYADWRVFVLKGVILCFGWLRPLWRGLYGFLLVISPDIPEDFTAAAGTPSLKKVALVSFFFGLFFCLLVTGALCVTEGTFAGTDPARRYFVQDGWNIALYSIVVPAYIAISVCLMTVAVHHWAALARFANSLTDSIRPSQSGWRAYAVLFLAILLCTFYVTQYMNDIMNPTDIDAAVARVYWFMSATDTNQRIPNKVGYYYIALNFLLQFIVLIGVACFLSMAAEVFRCAHPSNVELAGDFSVLQQKLSAFTESYLLMKGLVACLAINMWIWTDSPLGKTGNLLAAQIYLTMVGVFFVAIPRQYVELRWYELWRRADRPVEYVETRPWEVRATAGVLDAFFILSVISIWRVDFSHVVSWARSLFGSGA